MFKVTLPSPGTATTAAGALGKPAGVTEEEALDRLESPTILVATAVNVYAVPFTKVEISQAKGLAEAATMQVKPPGAEVIV